MRKMINALRSKSGQGMTEYVIIICIVAIACLLVVGVFGTNIRNLFHTANASLAQGQAQNTNQQNDGAAGNVTINNLNGN
ncbi:MAG: hypothetical protein EOM20_16345 [Spartobacteria bacterium]|nr:hypothetical protein [Spartobacteria bacterium]